MPQRKLLNCQKLGIVLETNVFQYVHHKKNHPIISTTMFRKIQMNFDTF